MAKNSGEKPARAGSRWLILIPLIAIAGVAPIACTTYPTTVGYSSSESSWFETSSYESTEYAESHDAEYHDHAESSDSEYHEDLESKD